MATMQTLAGRSRVGRAYGGFWRRGTAAAIDWLLLGVVVSLSIGYHGQLAPPHSTARVVVYYALVAALVWGYFAALEACAWRATLGKLVVGVRVTTLDGRRIGVGRATARLVAKFGLSLPPLGLGFVLAGVDARRQALHDRVAGTLHLGGAGVTVLPSKDSMTLASEGSRPAAVERAERAPAADR